MNLNCSEDVDKHIEILKASAGNAKDGYHWLAFKINFKNKETIEVDPDASCKLVITDGKKSLYDHEKFKTLCTTTLAKEPRYFLVDYRKKDDADGKTQIALVSWIPATGKLKEKMTYGSAAMSFKGKIGGLGKMYIQATCEAEIDDEEFHKQFKAI
eukprot:gb/GEZN01017583.1/.p1 GENE.gb/GEZN01017583.1/~~gb/GEZN01017583.1/.p1  ORF type:complete len:167 (-),score=23.12 gb/GEZN01017583.1/:291-758(-)